MARNGFFGVKNVHVARFTDEDTFEYEKPVHIPGAVEFKMEPSIEQATSYGDNEPWLDKYQDNGGSITWSLYDIESTPELRELLADINGFDIDAKGRVLATSGKTPKPFAFMCEQPGHAVGKRRCIYKCTSKPASVDAKTLEDKPDITQIDYELTFRPVTLPTGWRGCYIDTYSDLTDYDKFFEQVDTAVKPKTEAA
jgi:phi13 family phage major tail protein